MNAWLDLIVTIVGGVAVLAVGAGAREYWARRQIKAPTPVVSRTRYLELVLDLSRRPAPSQMSAYLPFLKPAGADARILSLQSAWSDMAHRDAAKIITSSADASLAAAAELVDKGIQVRIADDYDADRLSYHLFTTPDGHYALINHRIQSGKNASPLEFRSVAVVTAFSGHFSTLWSKSEDLVTYLSKRALDASEDWRLLSLRKELARSSAALELSANMREHVVRRAAIMSRCRYVLILGLPGSGKSAVRHHLEEIFAKEQMTYISVSDYPFLYENYVRQQLLMDPLHDDFKSAANGAFIVKDDRAFSNGLAALVEFTRTESTHAHTILIELARSNNLEAIKSFPDNIIRSAVVIHVAAPASIRRARLRIRRQAPRFSVLENTLSIDVSDNHHIPPEALSSLYDRDDIADLQVGHADNIFRIDNKINDSAALKAQVDAIIEAIILPYR